MFAPNSKHRALVTKAGRGRGANRKASDEAEEDTPAARRVGMIWAQRLKRVFRIDVETCQSQVGNDLAVATGGNFVNRFNMDGRSSRSFRWSSAPTA